MAIMILAVFVATLVSNILASLEVIEISRMNKWSSASVALVKSGFYFFVLFAVVTGDTLAFAPAYILGEVLANPIAIWIRERYDR